MGGVWKKLPYTWILMLIGTLALTGVPFLSGYFSKDAIIEFAYLKHNNIGYLACFVGIFTAGLTSIYSWRLIFKTFHGKYNNPNLKISSMHECSNVMLIPLIILGLGSIFVGYAFKDLLIGNDSINFWNTSIFFLNFTIHDHPPIWLLVFTPTLVIITIPISYYLFIKNQKILKKLIIDFKFLYNFSLNKWYFDEIYNFIFVNPIKKIGIFLWKSGDVRTIDRFGPDGVSKIIKALSLKAVEFQNGYLYHYAFVMLVGLSILLTYLILN